MMNLKKVRKRKQKKISRKRAEAKMNIQEYMEYMNHIKIKVDLELEKVEPHQNLK